MACGALSHFGGSHSHLSSHFGGSLSHFSFDVVTFLLAFLQLLWHCPQLFGLHRAQDKGLLIDLEAIDIAMSIMYSLLVILPWAAKEHVAHRHGNHITLDGVFIRSNLE